MQLNRIAEWLNRRSAAAKAARERAREHDWQRDPLSHPVLSRMSPHQLADLPLERALFDEGTTKQTSTVFVSLVRARPRPLRPVGQRC